MNWVSPALLMCCTTTYYVLCKVVKQTADLETSTPDYCEKYTSGERVHQQWKVWISSWSQHCWILNCMLFHSSEQYWTACSTHYGTFHLCTEQYRTACSTHYGTFHLCTEQYSSVLQLQHKKSYQQERLIMKQYSGLSHDNHASELQLWRESKDTSQRSSEHQKSLRTWPCHQTPSV